jgi:hypothetical protein
MSIPSQLQADIALSYQALDAPGTGLTLSAHGTLAMAGVPLQEIVYQRRS